MAAMATPKMTAVARKVCTKSGSKRSRASRGYRGPPRGASPGWRVGNVDLAGDLVAPCDHEHATERDVLTDHHPELGDLGVAKMFAQLGEKRSIDRSEIGRESFGEPNGEGFAWGELARFDRTVDLLDRFFVESLTRRRRVARKESGVAAVERCDFETRQLLDARGHDAFPMPRLEKSEIALEEIGKQLG